jgi:Domain of unknown function (DUF1772)
MWLTIAQLGYAHWFFGNVYEAVVRVPDRLAKDQRMTSLFSAGSPVRYYLPGVPFLLGGTLQALVTGWRAPRDRPWLAAAAACALFGVAATAYLVRAVNPRLLVAGRVLTPSDQDRLLKTWYRVNLVRLVAAGSA